MARRKKGTHKKGGHKKGLKLVGGSKAMAHHKHGHKK